jgi:hypothetical protein
VLRKADLTYVRTFRLVWPESIEGTELGDVEYALTRETWQAATPVLAIRLSMRAITAGMI